MVVVGPYRRLGRDACELILCQGSQRLDQIHGYALLRFGFFSRVAFCAKNDAVCFRAASLSTS